MEALGLRTEARSPTGLRTKGVERHLLAQMHTYSFTTPNPGPSCYRREIEAQRGEGAAQGHQKASVPGPCGRISLGQDFLSIQEPSSSFAKLGTDLLLLYRLWSKFYKGLDAGVSFTSSVLLRQVMTSASLGFLICKMGA